jgi:hypothetical protein
MPASSHSDEAEYQELVMGNQEGDDMVDQSLTQRPFHEEYLDQLTSIIGEVMARPKPLDQGGEVVSTIQAFARWFSRQVTPLPVDPVALLLAYEDYQSKLASSSLEIDWLPADLGANLADLVADAIDQSAGIIGCEPQSAAEHMTSWLRGACERWAALAR